jgi:asparagine synthetase B (glutamine-hydrolysing)
LLQHTYKLLHLSKTNWKEVDTDSLDLQLLKKRGPDSFRTIVLSCQVNGVDYTLVFAASVLSLRGGVQTRQVTEQPLVDDNTGNVLLWNGEIFASECIYMTPDQNDTQALLAELSRPTNSDSHKCNIEESSDEQTRLMLHVIQSIKGPYAFIFYHKATQCVYFGRDRLGRRSLLIGTEDNAEDLVLSSVKVSWPGIASLDQVEELGANGVHMLRIGSGSCIQLFEWQRASTSCERREDDDDGEIPLRYLSRVRRSVLGLHDTTCEFNDDTTNSSNANVDDDANDLFAVLKQSVARRVTPLPSNCKQCVDSTRHRAGTSVKVIFCLLS